MKFFVLRRSNIDTPQERLAGTEALTAEGTRYGDAPRCPECGNIIGLRQWLPPYRVELETWGREFGDFAFAGGGVSFLVSLRFKALWELHDLVGLSGFNLVELAKIRHHRRISGEPPDYFKADVIRGTAAVDPAASGKEWDRTPDICPTCRLDKSRATFLRQKGTVLEEGTWGGEDIFIPRASSDFVATERFKDFCEAHRVTNAVFVPAETHGCDFYPVAK
ncbi:MAG: hypothetical protein K1X74_11000 [Pirellulales bacterium]|nr:hypothetical protein [Pirellulales bacterium]